MCEISRASPSDVLKELLRSMPDQLGYEIFEEARNLCIAKAVTAVEAVRYIITEVPPSLRQVGNWRFYEILKDEEACLIFLKSGLVDPQA